MLTIDPSQRFQQYRVYRELMENLDVLKRYGLFDANVPRYTSYPPANRFKAGIGQRNQIQWLAKTPVENPISIYIHIPFCKRVCWFCACRTQGTKTLAPLDAYIDMVKREFETVSKIMAKRPFVERLHLGGGTPTLLSMLQMRRLLNVVFSIFSIGKNFEFSVEIDPTEASSEVLQELQQWGMNRASIGVQDFDPTVQKAIGRLQSFEQTEKIVDQLRHQGVSNINVDLLYGLPFQTKETLIKTIDKVELLKPNRIALYGYAHVPHASKRQIMINSEALPSPSTRYVMAKTSVKKLALLGYQKVGIDHFAKPSDSLVKASKQGRLHRNFQGYTDDNCKTLIGFGASAISKFPEGFSQNAVSTAAYNARISNGGLAGHKGYRMHGDDVMIARMIEMLMSDFLIDIEEIKENFATCQKPEHYINLILTDFSEALEQKNNKIALKPGHEELVRIIASALDAQSIDYAQHSSAI